MLKKAEDPAADDRASSAISAAILSQAIAPADEPVSRRPSTDRNGVNEAGRYYQGHLDYQYNYLTELIHRLQPGARNHRRSRPASSGHDQRRRGTLE